MRKRTKVLIGVLITVVILTIAGWVGWQQLHYPAVDAAVTAAKEADDEGNVLYFAGDEEKPLVIFYPGALVDAESYSVWAAGLAEKGYPVAIVKMPFNMAVLAGNRAEEVLEEIFHSSYVIGGHSLGGVMASRFAANQLAENDNELKGVFFFASYPDEKGSLADQSIAVLSLSGSQDQVVNQENWQAARSLLPETTTFQTIEGGNHAGFGTYGLQKGEVAADLPNEAQQEAIIEQMAAWLSELE
ncbi:alpha/beta hydrolase [Enterococcus casseliflavus]|uniref:alpha/beta hydrolase n=1 Tax=Enterococcus casseliflavus TaxID=37734 RepID=UPI00201CFC4F|nr:alpha/beta hydrolase [Enterococcus casseliflavus]